jgi:hypothetical protein
MTLFLFYLAVRRAPGVQPRALPGGRILDDRGLPEAAAAAPFFLPMDWAAGEPRGRRTACRRPPRARRVQDEGAFARAQGVEPERAPDEAEGVQLVRG